jgi:hypothetical protein
MARGIRALMLAADRAIAGRSESVRERCADIGAASATARDRGAASVITLSISIDTTGGDVR